MKESYLMGLEERLSLKRVGGDKTVEDEVELVDVDGDVDVDVDAHQTTNVNNTTPTSTTPTLLTPYSLAKNAAYPDTTYFIRSPCSSRPCHISSPSSIRLFSSSASIY